LNLYYKALEVVDEKALAAACKYKWYNQTLCQVNGSVVRLGVVQGEYHWQSNSRPARASSFPKALCTAPVRRIAASY
jgi:hypothetical protein